MFDVLINVNVEIVGGNVFDLFNSLNVMPDYELLDFYCSIVYLSSMCHDVADCKLDCLFYSFVNVLD